MKYAIYKKPKELKWDYNEYFKPNEPIEIHIRSLSWIGKPIYLAKKHMKTRTSTHASISNEYDLIESYVDEIYGALTKEEFIRIYNPARMHFLWLKEEELIFLASNAKSKHVLQKWDD